MIERHGLIVNVAPGRREEYLQLHTAVWPAVEATITAANITNYSIFIAGDTLIAYYEYVGEDHEADMKIIEADPVSLEWWSHTARPWRARGSALVRRHARLAPRLMGAYLGVMIFSHTASSAYRFEVSAGE
jgi:L-rhamnose mutarotase